MNPHDRNGHWILSPTCLPIPPLELNLNKKSERRDLNPRPSPWQGDALPLSYFRLWSAKIVKSNTSIQKLYQLSFIKPKILYHDIKELRSKAKDIVEFKQHLFIYLLINAGLFGIDYLHNGYLNWGYFVVLGWGVGIISQYISLKSGGSFPLKKKWNDLKNPKDKSPIVLAVF